jgi:hypothetical protein
LVSNEFGKKASGYPEAFFHFGFPAGGQGEFTMGLDCALPSFPSWPVADQAAAKLELADASLVRFLGRKLALKDKYR